jgi:hypothetical protein
VPESASELNNGFGSWSLARTSFVRDQVVKDPPCSTFWRARPDEILPRKDGVGEPWVRLPPWLHCVEIP